MADASCRRSKHCGDGCALGKPALSAFSSFFALVCLLGAGKNRRLKQAKEEAQAEIEQYRLQREKEFKAKEAAVGFSPSLNLFPLYLQLGLPCSGSPLREEQVATAALPQVPSCEAQPRVPEKPVEVAQDVVWCISTGRERAQ